MAIEGENQYEVNRDQGILPAKNYRESQQFYQDLGFALKSVDDEVAYFCHDNCAFLLQNFYHEELANHLMMHLLVENLDDWWAHVQSQAIAAKYAVRLVPPTVQPWGMRDFVVVDPSGVLWRIGENI
ncbi:MAG: glyoxalase [Synechococcales cyanobacterium RU_4_20]|nr:glyoxalase [Synechococcales cyanobacterium RU_4_20]NJR67631.1 glyoxalase [Synechococcales cyanobacterium CRU_2_2]